MVNANIDLANALREGLAPTAHNPEQITLQRKQLELDVELRKWASSLALTRARLLQDFIQTGLSPAEALDMTNRILPPTSVTPSGAPSDEILD
ncbi:hypothetical protein PSHT_01797 [Puccinia striiformis]|uniref:Uncharacterized protein n=1 Tax=Puccinia striiformis TaxID=27350 RepID=A0A2S4WJN9_9BASI|nr:hypothetical protein H4Q26_005351 [Puccinia striiformis f. sp. tritici PST-130]POW21958.1 hypothetical protein PSHT_01797 [Puccinia striiformis]